MRIGLQRGLGLAEVMMVLAFVGLIATGIVPTFKAYAWRVQAAQVLERVEQIATVLAREQTERAAPLGERLVILTPDPAATTGTAAARAAGHLTAAPPTVAHAATGTAATPSAMNATAATTATPSPANPSALSPALMSCLRAATGSACTAPRAVAGLRAADLVMAEYGLVLQVGAGDSWTTGTAGSYRVVVSAAPALVGEEARRAQQVLLALADLWTRRGVAARTGNGVVLATLALPAPGWAPDSAPGSAPGSAPIKPAEKS